MQPSQEDFGDARRSHSFRNVTAIRLSIIMASQTVLLWCTLHPAPEKEAEASFVREVLLGLAAKVREVEKTCLRYEVFEKNDTRGAGIVFHLLEKLVSYIMF
ncbi:hypothetical protein FJTKL_06912 [Diaporthe vaccinii]|uniref:Uncharacterized protein n=1 Tax=Diaporthe vaccinii TaxID=105482 RepID=A0ABR4EVU6_9PEZI